MQSNEIPDALGAAVEEVLETMCFASVLEAPEPEHGGHGVPALVAGLRFEGDPSGHFLLSVPEEFGRELSVGFLGQDEVTGDDTSEVVRELANMICGAALSRLDLETGFRLTHPELVVWPGPCGRVTRWFDTGGGAMAASIRLEPEP